MIRRRPRSGLVSLAALLLALLGYEQARAGIGLAAIATNLAKPVAIAHARDGSGRLFVALQEGTIVVIDAHGALPDVFLDIRSRVSCCSERGLLGVAFHPRYADNGFFYVNYTDTDGHTVVARYSVSDSDPNRADPDSAVTLLTVRQPFANHNGGHLAFGPDRMLYIGMGDGGSGGDPQNNAQNLGTLLGKMVRIDVDGAVPYAIPPDNPFVTTPGARPEIWALGLRNPWRFTFDRLNGDLFIGDVGQGSWEEINRQPAASQGGENYGWRLMEGLHCFNPAANCDAGTLVLPIIEYSHASGCSVTAGYRYRGQQIPDLNGTFVFADFCSGRISGATPDGVGRWHAAPLLDTSFNISTFGEDEAGEMYLANRPDDTPGAVYRVVAAEPSGIPSVTGLAPASMLARGAGFDLLVSGQRFAPTSVVRWNGSDRPTTFVSTALLSAVISPADISAAGQAAVTVFNPVSGGGLSNGRLFDIMAFLDVPAGFWASPFIDLLARSGITTGCGGGRFCPSETVTRAQAAVFLIRGMMGTDVPPPATGTMFTDVPASAFGAGWIELLAAMGLTSGCGGGAYCPQRAMTRGEMAVLLLRAKHGPAYVPPPASGTLFVDVPRTHSFAPWIEQLAEEGISAGCADGRYCPQDPVTRAQIAVFLVRTFEHMR